MLNSKSFLAVDFGALNIKLAEFELTEDGGLRLKQYGFRSLGPEGMQENLREAAMLRELRALLAERSIKASRANVCAPGFHTFSKFVKLPPVDTSKVTQIIQYEAQQNVPFPLAEVVWDYQILGAAPSGELEVLLVAIKSDVVEGLSRTTENAGLRLQLVDVSPAALCNAFRYNYGDVEGCSMLLDIGAKTSNLLFFDKGSVFARGINIGANAITQDFAKESKLAFQEAEQLKINEGFVSLGGAYEEPDNPNQAAISKIARQVLTRLHIQVNQTVQHYRQQQGGAAPERLYLSGGASIMPYTSQFFSEKLGLPVEYFNPFRNVQLDPALPIEDLAKVAHSMGEVVGLGLRNLAHCPVELNLMPKSTLRRQELNQKKPYFAAALFCLILIVFAFGWFYSKTVAEKERALADLRERVAPLEASQNDLQAADRELKGVELQLGVFENWIEDRFYWGAVFSKLREILLAVENKKDVEFGVPTGVWIERLQPARLEEAAASPGAGVAPPVAPAPPAGARPTRRAARGLPGQPSLISDISAVTLGFRMVNAKLFSQQPTANTIMIGTLLEELRGATNYFVAEGTALKGNQTGSDTDLTIGFEIVVKLKYPLE
ncbi:MAG TPA: type IV pilus assembly protein PilM [Methylomirabilota bacterium]|nr:type IV pilus assembly protein PilM [Methylomirabilota bacterium]